MMYPHAFSRTHRTQVCQYLLLGLLSLSLLTCNRAIPIEEGDDPESFLVEGGKPIGTVEDLGAALEELDKLEQAIAIGGGGGGENTMSTEEAKKLIEDAEKIARQALRTANTLKNEIEGLATSIFQLDSVKDEDHDAEDDVENLKIDLETRYDTASKNILDQLKEATSSLAQTVRNSEIQGDRERVRKIVDNTSALLTETEKRKNKPTDPPPSNAGGNTPRWSSNPLRRWLKGS